MNRKIVPGAMIAGFVLLSMAQAAPNLSGEWKMNASKSELGPIPPPEKFERTITHKDPAINYKTVQVGQQGEIKTEVNCTTDGKECVNKMGTGESKSVMKWDGNTLLVDSKRTFGDNELLFKEKWSLSEDGKTLTINAKIIAPQGEFDIKWVLEKQ